MKTKSWLKYFFIITAILLVVFGGNYFFGRYYSGNSETTLHFSPYIFEIAIYISIGVFLGLDHFLQEIKKIGHLKINIPKLIVLGMPSLYFSFYLFVYFGIGRYFPNVFTHPIAILLRNHTDFMHIFQLILGYTVITSLYKK